MKRSEMDAHQPKIKGINEWGQYISRYYAQKDAKGDEVVIKVYGGYRIVTADYYYNIWKKQK